jgi:Legionella pneumophila major outer membrane protein precursor
VHSGPAAPDVNFAGPLGLKPNWGGEGAVGFDWQAAAWAPWHFSGQFRYGAATKAKNFAVSASGSVGGTSFSGTATGNESLREDHWLVDFAVGRDFGVGASNAQWQLGVHVAELRAKLTANGFFAGTVGGSATATPFTLQEKSRFLAAGPRLGVVGSTPLGGAWSFDWLAGAAVLFGRRELSVTAATPNPPLSTTVNFNDNASVFNLDAQAGLSYWFTPATKITASYRFDGYFNALRTFNSAGNVVNVNRFYNGPMVRLTTTF